MEEYIGKVKLNYNYYPGEDYYNEGSSEDEVLDIVKNHTKDEYDSIIAERKSWSVLYHLSHIRENIVSFLPINENHDVLEIGAGCGAITGILSKKAKSVTCIDLSKKRSMINAYKNIDCDNVEIIVGNFQDIELELDKKYDYITLIGVFEYAQSYIKSDGDSYEDFLRIVSTHLKPDGKLVVAIENKYGLKYFAGCREDHLGIFFEGIEGYTNTSGIKTFSKNTLLGYAEKAGFKDVACYYPYPDYKLPMAVYSDEWLPKKGELAKISNFNFDQDRLKLFDEVKAYDSLIEDGEFANFSNSFLFVMGASNEEIGTRYVKYSDDRARRYRISTSITMDEVIKEALDEDSANHIEKVFANGNKLKEQLSLVKDLGVRVDVNKAELKDGKLHFELLRGENLAHRMCTLYEQKNEDEIEHITKKYVDTLRSLATEKCVVTKDFMEVFGTSALIHEGYEFACGSMKYTNADLNFDNLICDENDKRRFTIIDYEWVYDFPIPVDYVIFRALLYLSMEFVGIHADYNKQLEKLCSVNGISIELQDIFMEMEYGFGRHITKGSHTLGENYASFGKRSIPLEHLVNALQEKNEFAGAMFASIDNANGVKKELENLKKVSEVVNNEYERSKIECVQLKELCDAYALKNAELEQEQTQAASKCQEQESQINGLKELCDAYALKNAELEQEQTHVSSVCQQQENQINGLKELCEAYELKISEISATCRQQQEHINGLKELCEAYEIKRAETEGAYEALVNSTSWKLTAPIRKLAGKSKNNGPE